MPSWLNFSDKNKNLNAAPWQFSKVMRFHFKVRWISRLALFVQINYSRSALAWVWEMRKLLENGWKPAASSSLPKHNRSGWKRVPRMLSHLMFQVNGEVRFKWLISHFVCKPKMTNCRFLIESTKYTVTFQNHITALNNSTPQTQRESLHILTEQQGGRLRPKQQRSLDIWRWRDSLQTRNDGWWWTPRHGGAYQETTPDE